MSSATSAISTSASSNISTSFRLYVPSVCVLYYAPSLARSEILRMSIAGYIGWDLRRIIVWTFGPQPYYACSTLINAAVLRRLLARDAQGLGVALNAMAAVGPEA